MSEINLLDFYPKANRDLNSREKVTDQDRLIAKQFGREYFDGTRNQGYGGYRYDGRWKPIVKRFQEHYGLTSQSAILDVGSGKGFMLHDFLEAIPGVTVAGLDVSEYAIANTMPDVRSLVRLGNATDLPYPEKSFDLVIAINTIHNLKGEPLKKSLRELERVSRKHKFIVVDAYQNDEQKVRLLRWNLTAETILHCREWEALFRETGYTGDYYWFSP